ncbi:MAG TPA: R3H domain-containing nucleic acid-binding protein [Candidatus Paceibacterota bacterium]|jgi:spoIIIJ-associated protein|nr:R3H domain-containing nucleic acid-binding protein [Candidatus Paceibacterota bacterium]
MEPTLLKEFVATFLSKLGVETSALDVTTGHRTVVAAKVDDAKLLPGPGGEHLRALNTLAKRMIEKAHGEDAAAFLIDVNGHHESQMELVRNEARTLAQRARLFKHDVEMPPLSAYERLVIHELFANDPEIKTESAGEGKFRHIVLKYKDSGFAAKT